MALALRLLVIAGLAIGAVVTALGMLVDRWPALEIFNHGRPFMLAGTVALVALAMITRRKTLIALAAALALVNAFLFALALQNAAATASGGGPRFARIVTYNLWFGNTRLDDVASFLIAADADIVVIEEALPWQRDRLHQLVKAKYPYTIGDFDIVMFTKYAVREGGTVRGDRRSPGRGRRPTFMWTTFEIGGVVFDLAGVHLSRPMDYADQAAFMPVLTEFARDHGRPLIVAGDFNLTPWSVKLQRFARDTGLRRFNTFVPTWPADRLWPFVAIDNIYASPDFALMKLERGPASGSDHRPLIADIALARPATHAALTPPASYP